MDMIIVAYCYQNFNNYLEINICFYYKFTILIMQFCRILLKMV